MSPETGLKPNATLRRAAGRTDFSVRLSLALNFQLRPTGGYLVLSAIRLSRTFPHRRLWAGLLLSTLAHVMLLAPPPTTRALTLTVPAPELAVTFALDSPGPLVSKAESLPWSPPSVVGETVAAESNVVALSAPSAANHLLSLLRESLNRHFIYPPMAQRNGWQGRVELLIHLDQDGRLHAMRVVRSSGYPLLDEDALLTLRRIGSIPGARAWLPERGYATTLPVIYKLKEG